MARMLFSGWRFMRPGTQPLELPAGYAVGAVNCDLRQKAIGPLPGLGAGTVMAQSGDLRSFYEIDTGKWLAWETVNDVVELAVAYSDGRIAYTGDGFPKQTDITLATSGEPGTYPTQIRRLGVKPPTTPPTVEVINPIGAGTVLREVSYVYTMVTAWGEESAPSAPTAEFTVYEGESLNLTDFDWDTLADNDYEKIRIYRLEVGETGADYLFLAEILISVTDYEDDCLEDAGPDVLETEDWDCPPDDLAGLFSFGSQVLCGFSGKKLLFSVPGVAYAMPEDWSLMAQEDIVGAGYIDKTVVFVSAARQYRATGADPQYMEQDSLDYSRGCVSKQSLVSSEEGVFYAAADCLVLAAASGNKDTMGVYTARQWAALDPATLHGFYVDGLYYGFFSGTATGIVVDPANMDVQEISFGSAVFYAGRYNKQSRKLQVLLESAGVYSVHEWEADADTPLENSYTTAPQLHPADTSCSCGKVIADFSGAGATMELAVLVDGVTMTTKTITTGAQFWLPIGCVGSQWQIAMSGSTVKVDAVLLAGNPEELRNG